MQNVGTLRHVRRSALRSASARSLLGLPGARARAHTYATAVFLVSVLRAGSRSNFTFLPVHSASAHFRLPGGLQHLPRLPPAHSRTLPGAAPTIIRPQRPGHMSSEPVHGETLPVCRCRPPVPLAASAADPDSSPPHSWLGDIPVAPPPTPTHQYPAAGSSKNVPRTGSRSYFACSPVNACSKPRRVPADPALHPPKFLVAGTPPWPSPAEQSPPHWGEKIHAYSRRLFLLC